LLYWPSNKSSTTLSMLSSTGGIRHADGGGIGRSPAVAATLHCTINTWGFLPLFELFLLARLVHEQSGAALFY
jgi:hypothetical protein